MYASAKMDNCIKINSLRTVYKHDVAEMYVNE